MLKNMIDSLGLLQAIGKTPLIELRHVAAEGDARVMVKLEGANPGGSIKGRTAYYMIRSAMDCGELTPDKTILEPTSGNTGIGLAMVGAALGIKVKLCMPDCVSVERRRILEAFGAECIITAGCQRTDGAIMRARELMEENPGLYYMPDQFSNPANIQAHYETTGAEILKQTGGEIAAFVSGLGTTGTIMGVTSRLKEHSPRILCLGIEPTLGHSIQGLKNMHEAIVPSIYNPALLDGVLTVQDEEAFEMARALAFREGLFCGMSSGAAVVGALRVAREIGAGTVVTILPDRGDRYLSTTLFRSVCANCPP
mgnify:FL=1